MACNQKMAYRHNNYIARKNLYIKISIKIKIVELSKQPLSVACEGKKKLNIS